MPELPEVETIKLELEKPLNGKVFARPEVRVQKLVNTPIKEFQKKLSGLRIVRVRRRAKMLVLQLTEHLFLVFHLKMTGQLVFVPKTGKRVSGGHPIPNIGVLPNKFSHVIFHFQDGSTLYFNDQRKFGWARLVDVDGMHHLTAHLGLEPLSSSFTFENFFRKIKKYPRRMIKQALMDHELITGVGNIYADESCFCAGIGPTRRVERISRAELIRLHACIKKVLLLAIKNKGTTADTYRRINGESGNMLKRLNVYGRKGKPCKKCGTLIEKITLGQRGTHFCPHCQS